MYSTGQKDFALHWHSTVVYTCKRFHNCKERFCKTQDQHPQMLCSLYISRNAVLLFSNANAMRIFLTCTVHVHCVHVLYDFKK